MLSLIWIGVLSLAANNVDVDASQFARLINGLHADYKDVRFVYEGMFSPTDSLGFSNMDAGELTRNYQGVFSYRSDGAMRLDIFQFGRENDHRLTRDIVALLNGKLAWVQRIADLKHNGNRDRKGGPGAFDFQGSPVRLFYVWKFQAINDYGEYGYKFQGWEDVGGHQCLRVQFNNSRVRPRNGGSASSAFHRFWIDMNRGGHPLRHEAWSKDKLVLRVENIELRRLPTLDQKELWFPVKGELFTYLKSEGKSAEGPFFQESYSVLSGSVEMNKGLPDSHFSTDTHNDIAVPESMKRFHALTARDYPKPKLQKKDPASVQKQLERGLAEADAQSKMLGASSAAREAERASRWAFVLPVIGLLIVIGAVLLKWRSR